MADGAPDVPLRRVRARRSLGSPSREMVGSAFRAALEHDREEYARDIGYLERDRPRTYGDCQRVGLGTAERPCPYLRCVHHLGLDVSPKGGIRIERPDEEMLPRLDGPTCSLREALTEAPDDGLREYDGAHRTLEEVGAALGLTRERARQIVERALDRLAEAWPELRAELAVEARAVQVEEP